MFVILLFIVNKNKKFRKTFLSNAYLSRKQKRKRELNLVPSYLIDNQLTYDYRELTSTANVKYYVSGKKPASTRA